MSWYYMRGNEQIGPIEDNQFMDLINQGMIRGEQYVWREGMVQWAQLQTLGIALPQGASAGLPQQYATSGEGTFMCVECGGLFAKEDMIQHDDSWVCAQCKPVFFQRLREGAKVPSELRLASFWIRFGALIIDGLIIMVVNVAVMLLFAQLNPASGGDEFDFMKLFLGGNIFATIINTLFAIVYTTYFTGRYGATPGKMACGIIIVRPDGDRITYLRAFARYWAKSLSGAICYIGFIMAAFDDEVRTLHDRMCDTRVIYK